MKKSFATFKEFTTKWTFYAPVRDKTGFLTHLLEFYSVLLRNATTDTYAENKRRYKRINCKSHCGESSVPLSYCPIVQIKNLRPL